MENRNQDTRIAQNGPYGLGPLTITAEPSKAVFLPSDRDEYKGFLLLKDKATLLWAVYLMTGEATQSVMMEGQFTGLSTARKAVDKHLAATSTEKETK